MTEFSVRRARTSDVPRIIELVEPLVQRRILLGKERVDLYGSVQEFRVAEAADGRLIGAGALHVMWEDLGEVRTLAVDDEWLGHGVGHALLEALEEEARELGPEPAVLPDVRGRVLRPARLRGHGPRDRGPEVYAELVRSHDEGVAEFLDLARVKQNTLGNTRMLKLL